MESLVIVARYADPGPLDFGGFWRTFCGLLNRGLLDGALLKQALLKQALLAVGRPGAVCKCPIHGKLSNNCHNDNFGRFPRVPGKLSKNVKMSKIDFFGAPHLPYQNIRISEYRDIPNEYSDFRKSDIRKPGFSDIRFFLEYSGSRVTGYPDF